ncbi:MoaD/ThiS family protein [Chloroflexota bacterium]
MSVKINIHPFLSHLTGNQDICEVNGSTVGQCLEELVALYPELRERLFGKDGNLSNNIEIYVNMESSFPEELARPVKDGDELQIVIIITGG